MAVEVSSKVSLAPGNVPLPNFCAWQLLFAAMVVAQICVLVIHVADFGLQAWSRIGINTLLAQWLTLLCVAVLCLIRPWLIRLFKKAGYWVSWLLVIAISLLAAAILHWIDAGLGLGLFQQEPSRAGFAFQTAVIAGLVSAGFIRYLYIRQLWRQEVLAQTEARVEALQSRIRPHFLFNSLNSIASLIVDNPASAEAATEDLADLFRAALRRVDKSISLGEELDLARKYLALEQRRLGDRLRLDWRAGKLPRDADIPALILQPLVENAIIHGVQPSRQGGQLTLSGARDEKEVVIVITNSLPEPGAEPDAISETGRNQVALVNIQERLHYHYSGKAQLITDRGQDQYQAVIRIPYVIHRNNR